jgi:nucleotide-binding universal stress UspA family protein
VNVSVVPEPGTQLDGFRLGERIHAGGMAVLHAATGPETGFPLLVKIPRLGHGESAAGIISFEVEQMVLAVLKGPHVPRWVASGEGEQPYIVMERVEGQSLKEWADRAPVPPEEVARVGAALANALHSLHLQEAIHLDVKPSNVMLRPSGEAVLIDFGLAHHAHYPDLLAEEWRRPIGSAPYISPEQLFGVRCDPRSDVYALGVTLYELATGQLPFGSPSSPGGLRTRLYRDPVPPRRIVPALPEWLQEVILRCMEVDAARRYPAASQVAFDLANPDQVAVTERGRRLRRAGPITILKRWVRAAGYEPAPCPQPSAQLAGAPIVLVAIATTHQNETMAQALRDAVKRLLVEEHTRLACVTVIRPTPELGGSAQDENATGQRLKHRVVLRHWAEPLQLTSGRVSFHVLEANDIADALLEYARLNQVDHIVIGGPPREVRLPGMLGAVSSGMPVEAAPEPLQLLRLLGTASTKVATHAPCTVTVVRPRAG